MCQHIESVSGMILLDGRGNGAGWSPRCFPSSLLFIDALLLSSLLLRLFAFSFQLGMRRML
jgi:hypothetical protein